MTIPEKNRVPAHRRGDGFCEVLHTGQAHGGPEPVKHAAVGQAPTVYLGTQGVYILNDMERESIRHTEPYSILEICI